MYEHHSFRTDKISLEKVLQNKGLSIEEFKDKYVCIEDEKFAICIQKKHMELIKKEFDYFNSLSDRIKFSVFNSNIPYSSIPEFCSYLKNKCVNTLKQFLSDKTENIISLRIIVKAIAEQPLYLVEALQQYSDTLPENDKYYFRHNLIYGKKIREARDKFTGFNKSLAKEIRLLSASDTDKLKKLYSGLFYFTEQFISDLKQHQFEFKFLDSPLFDVFFKEIIYFKSYYQSEFGEFHFPEILEIEKKIDSQQKESEHKSEQQEKNHDIKFSDFFDTDIIDLDKINEIKETFSEYEGKNEAALIYLLKSECGLEIIPFSKENGLSKFHVLLTNKPKKYEAARKHLDANNEWKHSSTDETLLSIKEKLNKIIKT